MPGVCPRCLREVYFAEEKLALGKVWHTFCFSCRNCRKLLDSCTVATHCGELFCRNCCTRLFTPSLQTPSPQPILNLSVDHQGENVVSSACESISDCYCCYCCPENISLLESHPETSRVTRLDKQRLRGGGGCGGKEVEEETEEVDELGEETRRCSESDYCSNLGIVSSVTTLCNPLSSPTALTTWYNRQHSVSQSTLDEKNTTKNHLLHLSGNKERQNKRSVNQRPGGSPYRSFNKEDKKELQQSKLELQEERDRSKSQLILQESEKEENLRLELAKNQLEQQVNRNHKNHSNHSSLRYLNSR